MKKTCTRSYERNSVIRALSIGVAGGGEHVELLLEQELLQLHVAQYDLVGRVQRSPRVLLLERLEEDRVVEEVGGDVGSGLHGAFRLVVQLPRLVQDAGRGGDGRGSGRRGEVERVAAADFGGGGDEGSEVAVLLEEVGRNGARGEVVDERPGRLEVFGLRGFALVVRLLPGRRFSEGQVERVFNGNI